MTQQTINIGTMPNAGDGDKLRVAFEKVNENFTELYPLIAQVAGILGAGIVTPGNLLAAVNALSGISVRATASGALEALMPVQTVTGSAKAFGGPDLYRETRRSNAGGAMVDSLPPASAAGLLNGTTVQINNADASATLTLTPGAGTVIALASGNVATITVGPGRSTRWVYDAPAAAWRPTMNSLSALLLANALSEIAAAGTSAQASARLNLALGTAATQAVGTAAGNVVQLDGQSRLPAVDGSLLVNVLQEANNLSDVVDAAAALANLGGLAKAGGTLTGALNFAPAATVASAATTNIGAAASNIVSVTGTTAITSLGTIADGAMRFVTFVSAGLVLTYNATSLILPSAASITTQAGDTAVFRSLGGGNWTCLAYQRANGTALVAASVVYAAAADIRTGTDTTKALASKPIYDAAAPVAWGSLTGTYTPDMSTFLSATATLTGNITLANPSNMKLGQAGEIILTQDATGSRTIAFGSYWKFIGGTPTASTAANATDVLSYRVVSATLIIGSYGKNVS